MYYGIWAGFFTHAAYVSIQVCTNHEYMAVVISIYLACYHIGMALGSSISGAAWTNTLYPKIVEEFRKANIDTILAKDAYSSPLEFIVDYKWDTIDRIALVKAYRYTQKILCIVCLVLCFPLLFDTLLLRNHKLQSIQSLETNEQQCGEQNVVVNKDDDDIIFKKLKAFFKRS
jgi:SIT family siderophore-iron:H+ symporter-like MFS transporter